MRLGLDEHSAVHAADCVDLAIEAVVPFRASGEVFGHPGAGSRNEGTACRLRLHSVDHLTADEGVQREITVEGDDGSLGNPNATRVVVVPVRAAKGDGNFRLASQVHRGGGITVVDLAAHTLFADRARAVCANHAVVAKGAGRTIPATILVGFSAVALAIFAGWDLAFPAFTHIALTVVALIAFEAVSTTGTRPTTIDVGLIPVQHTAAAVNRSTLAVVLVAYHRLAHRVFDALNAVAVRVAEAISVAFGAELGRRNPRKFSLARADLTGVQVVRRDVGRVDLEAECACAITNLQLAIPARLDVNGRAIRLGLRTANPVRARRKLAGAFRAFSCGLTGRRGIPASPGTTRSRIITTASERRAENQSRAQGDRKNSAKSHEQKRSRGRLIRLEIFAFRWGTWGRPVSVELTRSGLRAPSYRNSLTCGVSDVSVKAIRHGLPLGLLLLLACRSELPEAKPLPASLERAPRLVESPEPKICSRETLARAAPWIGTILRRVETTIEVDSSPRVSEQWVICGLLDTEACLQWANLVSGEHVAREGLLAEVSPGKRMRGKLWTFDLGDRTESRLFSNNGAASAYLRTRPTNELRTFVSSSSVTEPRPYRVEIAYRKPWQRVSRPAVVWTWQLPRSKVAASDALLALEDLRDRGIQLDADLWDMRATFESAVGEPLGPPTVGAQEVTDKTFHVTVQIRCDDSV